MNLSWYILTYLAALTLAASQLAIMAALGVVPR